MRVQRIEWHRLCQLPCVVLIVSIATGCSRSQPQPRVGITTPLPFQNSGFEVTATIQELMQYEMNPACSDDSGLEEVITFAVTPIRTRSFTPETDHVQNAG
jgi:hypothetical protein